MKPIFLFLKEQSNEKLDKFYEIDKKDGRREFWKRHYVGLAATPKRTEEIYVQRSKWKSEHRPTKYIDVYKGGKIYVFWSNAQKTNG